MNLSELRVYYNGACPICRREINHYRHLDAQRQRIEWIDLATDPRALTHRNIHGSAALRRLHAEHLGAGQLLIGVDAFIAIWRHLPGYRYLAPVVNAPLIRQLAQGLYNRLLAPALFQLHRWRHGDCGCNEA